MVKEFKVCAAPWNHQATVSVEDEEHAEDEAPEEVDAEGVGDDVAGGDEEAAEGRPQGGLVPQGGQPAEHDQAEATQYPCKSIIKKEETDKLKQNCLN